jgi:RNA-directed DNA polymerase
LANFTLNGLEKAVEREVKNKYNVKKRGIYIGVSENSRGNVGPRHLSTNLATIRYADDFVILARSKRMIEETIKPCVERFLSERGL